MKINIFQKLIFVAVAATLAFTGCKKDPSLTDKLIGDWEIKSWVEDGDEYIGNDFSKATMEFEKPSGGEGDTNWLVTYDDGTIEPLSGEYEVDEDAKEVKVTFSIGGDILIAEFDIDLDGDDLELSGNLDGTNTTIKAERD